MDAKGIGVMRGYKDRMAEEEMETIKNLLYGEQTDKLAFSSIDVGDALIIETRNSTYRFLVIDAVSGQGILTGGMSVGNAGCALLIGVSVEDKNGFRLDTTCLKVGGRAIFHLDTDNGIDRLITSGITSLFHIRDGKAQKRIA